MFIERGKKNEIIQAKCSSFFASPYTPYEVELMGAESAGSHLHRSTRTREKPLTPLPFD